MSTAHEPIAIRNSHFALRRRVLIPSTVPPSHWPAEGVRVHHCILPTSRSGVGARPIEPTSHCTHAPRSRAQRKTPRGGSKYAGYRVSHSIHPFIRGATKNALHPQSSHLSPSQPLSTQDSDADTVSAKRRIGEMRPFLVFLLPIKDEPFAFGDARVRRGTKTPRREHALLDGD